MKSSLEFIRERWFKLTHSMVAKSEIAYILGNKPLTSAIYHSITAAIKSHKVHLNGGKTVGDVFNQSLSSAIRDIENDPRGKLFLRLLRYGPPLDNEPEQLTSDGETALSDPECGACIDFIYSHMVNRFKGELAELLALEPCMRLLELLVKIGRLTEDIQLYWGNLVQERRRGTKKGFTVWGSYAKGADGLLIRQATTKGDTQNESIQIHGIVEVKSMSRSNRRIIDQIEHHKMRLLGGVRLGSQEWSPDSVQLVISGKADKSRDMLIYITVVPSKWKLSRVWQSKEIDSETRRLILPKQSKPPVDTRIERVKQDIWKITLAWSQEILHEAAFHMTMWYMAQVGTYVFTDRQYLKQMRYSGSEEAGVDRIKFRLYEIQMRYISKYQLRRATKIYNAYCFGYPLAADAKSEPLWPDDFPG